MLSAKYRIPKSHILDVIKKGNTKIGEGFYIKYILDDAIANSLYSFSVSTKVSKSSVIRNRLKRLFKAAVCELETEGKLKKGSYAFVIKSSELRNLKSDEVVSMIQRLFL